MRDTKQSQLETLSINKHMSNVTVTAPANPPLNASLTEAQLAEFAALIGGIPSNKALRAIVIQISPDGTGRLQVQTQDLPAPAVTTVNVAP